jgi:hypothetical protein
MFVCIYIYIYMYKCIHVDHVPQLRRFNQEEVWIWVHPYGRLPCRVWKRLYQSGIFYHHYHPSQRARRKSSSNGGRDRGLGRFVPYLAQGDNFLIAPTGLGTAAWPSRAPRHDGMGHDLELFCSPREWPLDQVDSSLKVQSYLETTVPIINIRFKQH